MRIFLLIGVFFLAGCADVSPQKFNGPNGKTAYSMRCSGTGRTLDDCYKKAGEVCSEGYAIIDITSGFVAMPINGGIMAAPQHNIAIECK